VGQTSGRTVEGDGNNASMLDCRKKEKKTLLGKPLQVVAKVPGPILASEPQKCGAKPLRVSALLTTEAAITLSSRSKQS